MGKSKRAKKKLEKRLREENENSNKEAVQKIYKTHKEKDHMKVEQNKEIFDKKHEESKKFKKLCNHEEPKGAILEEDINFIKFKFDEKDLNKETNKEKGNKRNENLYNIGLEMQSNSTTKYQVYKKDKKSDAVKTSQSQKDLEKDVEYDFEKFIPQ